VKKEGKVIIRNLRKSYFANYPEERIKSEKNQLAWFVYERIGDNEELVDIAEIISGNVQQEDHKIVYRGRVQECSKIGFLKALSSREMRLRSKWIWKKEWDFLTVDFYCAF
jgi:hypothetical protein